MTRLLSISRFGLVLAVVACGMRAAPTRKEHGGGGASMAERMVALAGIPRHRWIDSAHRAGMTGGTGAERREHRAREAPAHERNRRRWHGR